MENKAKSASTKFEVYRDAIGEYRWTASARNGRVIADSAESYKRKVECIRAVRRLVEGIVLGGFVVVER